MTQPHSGSEGGAVTVQGTATAVIPLAGTLTIATAAQTRATLLAAIPADGDVMIDCREASGFDASFLQLLESTRLLVMARGGILRLAEAVPDALRQALTEAGLTGWAEPAGAPS
ncbi:STAS domain-containing protein [Paracraurococcus ruber]|nr:STAS domain-containing protein [Paracraurococcus ruber]